MLVAFESPTAFSAASSAEVEIQPSFILRATARQYHWQGSGFLSIKSFFGGRALYRVGSGFRAVDDQSYLILNHAQPYTIAIESTSPVESCCLFFSPHFVREVYHSLSLSTASLLEAPRLDANGEPPAFFDRTYPHDALVSPAMLRLRHATDPSGILPTSDWLLERSRMVLCRLLVAQRGVRAEVEALPAVRAATRDELYRRLHWARDYINALSATRMTLDDMARIADLSPTHFLRTFKQAFHETPHRYLTMRRLEHAKGLLRQTHRPITDICFAVGFESLGSFSKLFKRWVGESPQSYRRTWRAKR